MDNEVKAAIDAFIKELAQNEKALAAIPEPPKADKPALASPQADKLMTLTKAQAEKAVKAYQAMDAGMQQFDAELQAAIAAALAQCKAGADKATKAYMDAVKNTDGLTSAKPSIVKVLQATGKMPDPAAIQTAVDELGKHRDEITKKYGKDKDKAKMVAAFTKDLDTAAKALGGLI